MNVLFAFTVMPSIALAMFLGRNKNLTSTYWLRKAIARPKAPDSGHVRKGGETNKILCMGFVASDPRQA